MKYSTASALLLAATIAIAIASPARYYNFDDEEDSGEKTLLAPRAPYALATAPFYYQPRTTLEELPSTQRKYQIVKKKKKPGLPGSEEDEPQDDEEESSEEEQDEEGDGEEDEEESLDVPPWEELFPEEDKNTGTFDDQNGSGIGGGPMADATLPGGAPAPESSGSLMNFFGGGSSGSSEGAQGGSGYSGPQRSFGPPPRRPSQKYSSRGRTSLSEEEPRSGGAVLFDGYRYIPVNPVQVRVPQRQAKKTKSAKKQQQQQQQQERFQSRSLPVSPSPSRPRNNDGQRYVLVPFQQRDNREIRFSRDDDGFKVERGPIFGPTEIWRWEGAGGRPLRRRDNRPGGIIYASSRPHQIRFSEESDY